MTKDTGENTELRNLLYWYFIKEEASLFVDLADVWDFAGEVELTIKKILEDRHQSLRAHDSQ